MGTPSVLWKQQVPVKVRVSPFIRVSSFFEAVGRNQLQRTLVLVNKYAEATQRCGRKSLLARTLRLY